MIPGSGDQSTYCRVGSSITERYKDSAAVNGAGWSVGAAHLCLWRTRAVKFRFLHEVDFMTASPVGVVAACPPPAT